MLKVKNGDLDKLGLLFDRYHRKLYRFFYRMTHRRDISEDLVQSVFERILKYRSSYTEKGSFTTWIFKIARNVQVDHYRSRKNKEKLNGQINWNELAAEPAESKQEQEKVKELKMLQQALNQLDNTKKQTLVLSRFQGFKYKEIASIMNCSESAVKVRIFRAMQELEVLMKELYRQL